MRLLYNILAILIVIVISPVFIIRFLREKSFGQRVLQNLGIFSPDALANVAGRDCIWLHAASVGEIVATSPIVKEIKRELPGIPVLVSVVTASGYEMAERIIPDADNIIFFPLDLPGVSANVVRKIKPRAFMPVETELWPNFLQAARRYNVTVMMVNGRISDKSVKRYRYLFGILDDMVDSVSKFCMQSDIDAEYIIRLGANPQKVTVTGNTKFDQTYTDVSDSEKKLLARELGIEGFSPVLVAGSTHKGEEEYLFAAFDEVLAKFSAAKLVLAPRDVLRTDEIVSLAAKKGLAAVSRTELLKNPAIGHHIVIVDTIGELGKIYSIGDIIFVGGSLVPHGGHNILEPAAHGKPILIGSHMFNFKDSYALFSKRQACLTVEKAEDLADKVLYILENDDIRQRMCRETFAIIRENRGAAKKSAIYLKELLGLNNET